jgi:hypothetical protein
MLEEEAHMSENITHTAVTDDCARLAIYAPSICAPFKEVLSRHLDIARMGGVTRAGGKYVVSLLRRYREVWSEVEVSGLGGQKLAFVLGWLCHRAADLQMKPIFRAVDGECVDRPTDCSVYHDVFLFRTVYANGQGEPYAPGILSLDVGELETVLRSLWQRALIGLHTFIPDQDDIEGWLERLFQTRQEFYVDLKRYAEAFACPDPDKLRRFLDEVSFYDPQDPLIRLARSIQAGVPEAGIDLPAAVAAAAKQSQYAQALRRGYLYLEAASSFFEGRLDEATFADALERGKQGVT